MLSGSFLLELSISKLLVANLADFRVNPKNLKMCFSVCICNEVLKKSQQHKTGQKTIFKITKLLLKIVVRGTLTPFTPGNSAKSITSELHKLSQ